MSFIRSLLTFIVFIVGLSFYAQKVKFPSRELVFELNELSSQKFNVNFEMSEINFSIISSKSNSYTKINIPSFFKNNDPGFPELVKYNQLFEVPINGHVEVEIISKKSRVISLDSMNLPIVIPSQRSISKGEDPNSVDFQKNNKIYSNDIFFKYDIVKVAKTGIFRRHQLSRLEICPFEYNPVKNELIVFYDIEFDIYFINSSLSDEFQSKLNYNQSEFSSVLNNCINKKLSNERDYITTYPTKYVIVSDPSFQQQIQPLIDWKTKKGFTVVEAYTNDPQVGNTTTSIKSYLSNLYNNPSSGNPPSYILLVGDVAEIPSFSGLYGNHVSDLYYAEYDGNGDIYADVYYGRFSSSDPLEIQNMVNKSINYEQYSFQDPSFLSDVVMISGVDATMAPTYGNGQINYANQYYTNLSNGINSKTFLYPASGSSSSQILQEINNGCSFANYTAHGYGQGWADPAFTCTDVHSMTNIGKPAMMIGNCCLSNKFDDPECFGEALLRVDNKGAIGYIGGSNNTYWNEDFWWAVGAGTISANPIYDSSSLGFYDKLFHSNGESPIDWYTTNAQIMMAGNLAVTQAGGADDYYCEIYHLMGDPSLTTYFGVPSPLVVQHDQIIPFGMPSVDIITEEGSYVALTQNGVIIDAGLVSNNGVLTLDISSIVSLDSLEVVVSKQNKIPYFGDIQIISPNGVFLSNSNNSFIDVIGNLDGAIDFNEVIEVDATIKNYGNLTANGVYANLTCNNNHINLIKDSSNWGTLTAGSSLLINGAFKFEIDGSVPDQEVVQFQLEIFDQQSNSWISYFQIQINSPNSILNDVLILDDQTGNNNNRLDPGETLQLKLPTQNLGHTNHLQLMGDLTCNSSAVQFLTNNFNLGALAVGQEVNAVFDISIDSSFVPGNMVSFTYNLTDGDYTVQYEFDLIVGLVIEDFHNGNISTNGWTNNSLFPWVIDSLFYYNDNYSFKSSNSNADQTESILELQLYVTVPSDISFMKKVSSEESYDYLRFSIDNLEIDSWSGEDDWSYNVYNIDTGYHNFKWIYEKDFSVSDGLDAAWIDEVVFPISQETNVSIGELENFKLHVYPNPANSILYINANSISIDNVVLHDLYGRSLIKNVDLITKNDNIEISTRKLSSGIYLFQFLTDKGVFTERVVINK